MTIYWDHNATSPLRERVRIRMTEALEKYPANPNSSHSLGQQSRAAIEEARRSIAERLGVDSSELIFTASATEANLLALWGLWFSQTKSHPNKRKILISPIEHSSIYENVQMFAEKFGANIIYAPLTESGRIDLTKLGEVIENQKDEIAFCSILGAHNETGILQPWKEIAEICAKSTIPFHSDLVQWLGRLPLRLASSSLASATFAFHKLGGPKGVGVLFWKKGLPNESLIRGGPQEKKRRAGTENIAAILGAQSLLEDQSQIERIFEEKIRPLRDEFEAEALREITGIEIVAAGPDRLPNTSYIIFPEIKSEALLMRMDLEGICLSAGSACSSGLVTPSRSLLQLGYSEAEALRGIRFSLGVESSREEMKTVLHHLKKAFERLAA